MFALGIRIANHCGFKNYKTNFFNIKVSMGFFTIGNFS